jgi:hypothetical protein
MVLDEQDLRARVRRVANGEATRRQFLRTMRQSPSGTIPSAA